MAAAITIERMAEMRAEMDAGRLREDVLLEHNVSADAWGQAQIDYLTQMKKELTSGRFDLSTRYSNAFVARQQKLLAQKPAGVESTVNIESRAKSVEAAPRPTEALPFRPGQTGEGLSNALRHAELTAPKERTFSPMGSSTELVGDIAAIARKVMPFGAGGPKEAAPAYAAPVPLSTPASPAPLPTPAVPPPAPGVSTHVGATVAVFELPKGLVTPFAGKASDDAAVENAKRHAEQTQKPVTKEPPAIGGTVAADELAAVMKKIMPFPGATPPKPAAAPTQAASSQPAGVHNSAVAPRNFTLEQYASLCEDLTIPGRAPAEVLARYRLTAEEHRALDAHWGRVFSTQPEVKKAWEKARETYRAWIGQKR